VFFADTFATPASGVVTVQEYRSTLLAPPCPRSVSTKTTSLLADRRELAGARRLAATSDETRGDLRGPRRIRPGTSR
jgi:hypothetical protein